MTKLTGSRFSVRNLLSVLFIASIVSSYLFLPSVSAGGFFAVNLLVIDPPCGTVTFGNIGTYTSGVLANVFLGAYQIRFNPIGNAQFVQWTFSGGVFVPNGQQYSNPSTAVVFGSGTLAAVASGCGATTTSTQSISSSTSTHTSTASTSTTTTLTPFTSTSTQSTGTPTTIVTTVTVTPSTSTNTSPLTTTTTTTTETCCTTGTTTTPTSTTTMTTTPATSTSTVTTTVTPTTSTTQTPSTSTITTTSTSTPSTSTTSTSETLTSTTVTITVTPPTSTTTTVTVPSSTSSIQTTGTITITTTVTASSSTSTTSTPTIVTTTVTITPFTSTTSSTPATSTQTTGTVSTVTTTASTTTSITLTPSTTTTSSSSSTSSSITLTTSTITYTSTPSVTTTQPGLSQDSCGYPYSSSNPLTNIPFNENAVLAASAPSIATSGQSIDAWYSDEHALLLGVRQVNDKTTGTVTNYPVTTLSSNPGSAINPQTGDNALTGSQAAVDPSGRPLWPALFITDITNNPNNHAGDWQSGGTPVSPSAVYGTWKSAIITLANSKSGTTSTITLDNDPSTKNNLNVGSFPGAHPFPSGVTPAQTGYGSDVQWGVDQLANAGFIRPGHVYRLQFMVHDGDQNKVGGDVGEACATVIFPQTTTTTTTWTVTGHAALASTSSAAAPNYASVDVALVAVAVALVSRGLLLFKRKSRSASRQRVHKN